MRTLIENGTLVTASDTFEADLVIEGETIAAIGKGLAKVYPSIDRTIDARGKYVIPGGIDVHTHLDMPFGGTTSADYVDAEGRTGRYQPRVYDQGGKPCVTCGEPLTRIRVTGRGTVYCASCQK